MGTANAFRKVEVVSRKSSIRDCRQPAASNQPPATSRQLSAAGNQPLTYDRQTAAISNHTATSRNVIL